MLEEKVIEEYDLNTLVYLDEVELYTLNRYEFVKSKFFDMIMFYIIIYL